MASATNSELTLMIKRLFSLCLVLGIFFSGKFPSKSFSAFIAQFTEGYRQLEIPGLNYDYRDYFNSIPNVNSLNKQEAFFTNEKSTLSSYDRSSLNSQEMVSYDHMKYEIEFNLQRI